MKVFIWITAVLLVIGSMYGLFCYINRDQQLILSYKNCKVPFKYSGTLDTFDLEYKSAGKKLADCVCESYIKNGDPATSKKIMELYKKYGYPIKPDSPKYDAYKSLDSIVKYRKLVFDPVIGWD